MLVQTFLLLLFGLQNSWSQTPPPPALPPPPPALPAPPVLGAPTTQEALPAELPPAVVAEDQSDFLEAEAEALRPTNRDPFAKPQSLLEKEVESVKPIIDPSVYIDMRIEPIRRFPLRNYSLVGIIFDVENPKAMVKDLDSNMHLLTVNQRIGNQEGLIIKIERGELVVEEKGKLITIKLHK